MEGDASERMAGGRSALRHIPKQELKLYCVTASARESRLLPSTPLAQLELEHLSTKQKVVGSSPTRGAIFERNNHYANANSRRIYR